ncbi:hypothetical protein EJD97_003158 [Solanum chilense]|uniref:Disease resistance protein At4g27190-like leucine-rich repeats domain-containing protein n=1 Tax=Solanum chilense TaxID=4083 RepID=A0A6N2AKI5_SOLCI|nr:hypothetical protein EJD97_003158 [Solanum chilense]
MHDVVRDVAISIVSEGEHNFMAVPRSSFAGIHSEVVNYSTLSELKSLSRLTALTLSKCAEDVIYSNLSLSSKLTWYNLTVSDMRTSIMDDYDRNITLEVMETRPLGNWICHLLKESELIRSTGKSSYNVLTELQQNKIQNVKCLHLARSDLVKHLLKSSGRRHEIIDFLNLYELKLQYIKCLTHFFNDNVEAIKFPQLRKMIFDELPKFQNFWPTTNNSITISNPLFHEKVSCLNLKELDIYSSNISSLCSHQLPIAYFSKLETFEVKNCRKLRNLISPSVTRLARNLRIQLIENCVSMEKVITQEEQQGEEIMNNEPLFPLLEELQLEGLPKLGHFFLTNCALEFPFLRDVKIDDCPVIKTLSVSTPGLAWVNYDDGVEVDDFNEWIQQRFNSKEQNASEGTIESDKSEANDGDRFEAADDSEG